MNDCSFIKVSPSPNYVLVQCEVPTKRVLGSSLGLESGHNPMKDENLRRAVVLAVGKAVTSLAVGNHCYLPLNKGFEVEKFYRLNKPGQDTKGQYYLVKEEDIWGAFEYVDMEQEALNPNVVRGLLTRELEDLQINHARETQKRLDAKNNSNVSRITTYKDIPEDLKEELRESRS